jgi:hypothetical protein
MATRSRNDNLVVVTIIVVGSLMTIIVGGFALADRFKPTPDGTPTPTPTHFVPTPEPTWTFQPILPTSPPIEIPTIPPTSTPIPQIARPEPTATHELTADEVLRLLIPNEDERKYAAVRTSDSKPPGMWVVDTKDENKQHTRDIYFQYPGYGTLDFWGDEQPPDPPCEPMRFRDGDFFNWHVICPRGTVVPLLDPMDGVTWRTYDNR